MRLEPNAGGSVEFSGDPYMDPTTGTVLAFDPPNRLAFTWGPDELHLTLEPAGDNSCTLTLIDVLEARDTAARNATGWSVCLAELDKQLDGLHPGGPHSDTAEPWRPYYDAYVTDGMPSGAEIPDAA